MATNGKASYPCLMATAERAAYAALISKVGAAAVATAGSQKAAAEALGFSSPKSMMNSFSPGGCSLARLLDVASYAQLSDAVRGDLVFAHVLWKLSELPEGKAAIRVILDADGMIPEARRGAFRDRVVSSYLAEIAASRSKGT